MSSTPRKTRGAKSIGHYILMKTIGEGTFGKVKLGTHILTGERVAVKVLEKERIVDIADVERVAREIHILKLIRHPHIIQLYEIIETPRQLYLIMEYASGGELFDYIVAHGKAQEPEACRFLHQILAGVEKVHAMRVVHRDLKPENLLLDDRKDIKIVDFGLSNTYQESQLLQTACGSPCYAAPEMIAGRRYVPSMVDIWSCGVILFALVCGYLPFEDQNHAELYKKILNAEYEIPNTVSKEVADLISGMLTTDPTRRMTLNDIRQHPWYRQIPEASKKMTDSAGNLAMDEEVLEQLDSYGYQREYSVKCLQTNKHNHVTTTYYLLLEKRKRAANEGKSAPAPLGVADLEAAGFEDFNAEVPGATTAPAAVTAAAVAAVATPSRSGVHAEAERCSHSGRRGARPGTWLDADGVLQMDGHMPTTAATGPVSSTDPLLASAETPPATARTHVPRLNLGGLPHDAAALAAEDSHGKAGHESRRPGSGAASASGRSAHSQGPTRRYHGEVHSGTTPQSARPRHPSPNTPRERLAFDAGTPRGASGMGRRPLSARAGAVKTWVVKHPGHKSTQLRREPKRDDSAINVITSVRNGEIVTGEFMYICRASTEAGFVEMKHLEPHCGSSWRVTNADGAAATLVRKQPTDDDDERNAVGYAQNGELVEGGYVFVCRQNEKRGGYIKVRHLRTPSSRSATGQASAAAAVARAALEAMQRWVVMDSAHDGAWLRKDPVVDRTRENILRLIPNGDSVAGDFIYVRRRSADAGYVKFMNLASKGGKSWCVHNASREPTTLLRKEPREDCGPGNTVAHLKEGEIVEGEFVHVSYKDGEHTGHVRRAHLSALAARASSKSRP